MKATSKANLLKRASITQETRLCSSEERPFFGNFNVIADTVIIHTPSLENPKIIEMRDQKLAKLFGSIFDIMWTSAKPIKI